MPADDTTPEKATPIAGPGVTAWLSGIIGAPRASKADGRPLMPDGFETPAATERRLSIILPDEVVKADSGTLQRLEIRGLPKGVVLTGGKATNEGFWQIDPDEIQYLAAIIPQTVDLPFSVMLKGVFVGDDPDTPWSELTGYEFADDGQTPLESEPPETLSTDTPKPVAPEPEATPEPEPTPEPEADSLPDLAESMIAVDLDVSVGTDDPAVLKDITVRFSGLPKGAILNNGTLADGIWTVPAAELSNLCIVIPEDTADFELDVEMEFAGSEPQAASIQVTNTPVLTDPASAFTVRLAAADANGSSRISIYEDGSAILDRILNWSAVSAPFIELRVPYVDNALPFEIVMRHAAFGEKSVRPLLLGLEIDGTAIAPDSPAISANGTLGTNGLAWQGDLVVDVRHALKPVSAAFAEEDTTGEQAHQPSEMAEPSAVAAHDPAPNEVSPSPDTLLAPDEAPALSDEEEPVNDLPVGGDDFDIGETEIAAVPPSVPDMPAPEPENIEKSDTLIVDASFSDLQKPAFLNELRNLRDFIRTRPSDDSGEIYDRLGIDVTKWHDMAVRGPTGAPVVLDNLLPQLAPKGGIDNARDLLALALADVPNGPDVVVRISGLPAGAMLTKGQNLGQGIWQLNVRELAGTAVLPAINDSSSTALHIAWNGPDRDGTEVISPRKTLVVGQKRKPIRNLGTEMCTVNLTLDPAIFDPDGHGALSVTIGDMPPGAILSNGRNHGGGVWTLEQDSGQNITLHVAAATRPFAITLTCVALNVETGDSTVVSRTFDVMPAQAKSRLRSGMAA